MKNMRLWFVLGLIGWAAGVNAGGFDWAPLISHDADVNGDTRWRALGPLIEFRTGATNDAALWAVRPLASSLSLTNSDYREKHVVWPLYIGRHADKEDQWRFAVLMVKRDYDVTDPHSRYRFWILPVYFQGRDRTGDSYLGIFPIGGRINELMGRNCWFALWPLASNARINEVNTRSYLWPIYSRTTGHGYDCWRIAPFYGYAKKGDLAEKQFVMWPIWTSVRYNYAGGAGSGFVLFPLYGHVKLEDQESWMVLPPFFRFSNGKKGSQVNAPYPLYQSSTGAVEKLYLFPVWGRKHRTGDDYRFVLWPLCQSTHLYDDFLETYRFMGFPLVYTDSKRMATKKGEAKVMQEKSLKIWPLFSYKREGDRATCAVPSIWPYWDYAPIERNYAPLWTLYRRSSCGAVTEDELLWGLFKYRRSPAGLLKTSLFPVYAVDRTPAEDRMQWTFLKGLVGYDRTGKTKTYQVLYFLRF